MKAEKLRARDILCTVNGEYVIVEQTQHEILESPVTVYNFRVAKNHTYYVGRVGVGMHNAKCAETGGRGESGSKSKWWHEGYVDNLSDIQGGVIIEIKVMNILQKAYTYKLQADMYRRGESERDGA